MPGCFKMTHFPLPFQPAASFVSTQTTFLGERGQQRHSVFKR